MPPSSQATLKHARQPRGIASSNRRLQALTAMGETVARRSGEAGGGEFLGIVGVERAQLDQHPVAGGGDGQAVGHVRTQRFLMNCPAPMPSR